MQLTTCSNFPKHMMGSRTKSVNKMSINNTRAWCDVILCLIIKILYTMLFILYSADARADE